MKFTELLYPANPSYRDCSVTNNRPDLANLDLAYLLETCSPQKTGGLHPVLLYST
jgi:hypothetical protein